MLRFNLLGNCHNIFLWSTEFATNCLAICHHSLALGSSRNQILKKNSEKCKTIAFSSFENSMENSCSDKQPRSHLQPLAATCNHLQTLAQAATCSHLQPLAANRTSSHLQLLAATGQATACSHKQPQAVTSSHKQPLAQAATSSHQQPQAATCPSSHLQLQAATCSYKQPLATPCNHLQPLAAPCSHLQPL